MRSGRRRALVVGNFLFFLAGPCLEAGVGPWVLVQVAGRAAGDVTGGPRVIGAALILASLGVLLDVFVRFVREGAGTPSPAAPAAHVIAGGVYRYIRHPMYAATASIIFGEGVTSARPGSIDRLVLVVYDIDAARDELVTHGVEVSEIFHDGGGALLCVRGKIASNNQLS